MRRAIVAALIVLFLSTGSSLIAGVPGRFAEAGNGGGEILRDPGRFMQGHGGGEIL